MKFLQDIKFEKKCQIHKSDIDAFLEKKKVNFKIY